MSLTPKRDAEALRQHLAARLKAPARLDYFARGQCSLEAAGQPCGTCVEAQLLLEEVAAQPSQIQIRAHHLETGSGPAREMGAGRATAIVLREPPSVESGTSASQRATSSAASGEI